MSDAINPSHYAGIRRESLRPRWFRWSLTVCCNHPNTGGFLGYTDHISIGLGRGNFQFGTDYLDDHELELDGPRIRFKWESIGYSGFWLGRRSFRCVGYHYGGGGSWVADACLIERSTVREIGKLLKRRGWSTESGSERLWKWWEGICV